MMLKKYRLVFLVVTLLMLCSSCYLARAYRFRNFDLLDHQKLPATVIKAPAAAVPYAETAKGQYSEAAAWLDSNLKNTLTAAFLVIKNDTVVYETYFEPYTRKTLLPSFSVAKSFVSTLVAIALQEGKISSLSEPITNYIPEFKKKDARFAAITLQHLLDMRSGIRWNEEGYGLKDDAVKLIFRPNMMKHVLQLTIEKEPGGDFEYQSINTLLLAIVVERATQKKLPVYLDEKIWQPLGMESDATWNKDKHGLTFSYAALNAVARDFAKLGTLFLHKGNFNGQQIVSENWVQASVSRDTMAAYSGYRNQWWGVRNYKSFSDSISAAAYKQLLEPGDTAMVYKSDRSGKSWYIKTAAANFFAQGILGQFVYVCPSRNMVIVRLGHNWSHPKYYATDLFNAIENKF